MRVDVELLRKATNRLLDDLSEQAGGSIDLPDELYWFIAREQLCKPESEPRELTLGSLADDYTEVSAIGASKKPPIRYALVWLASILRVLGDMPLAKDTRDADRSSE